MCYTLSLAVIFRAQLDNVSLNIQKDSEYLFYCLNGLLLLYIIIPSLLTLVFEQDFYFGGGVVTS